MPIRHCVAFIFLALIWIPVAELLAQTTRPASLDADFATPDPSFFLRLNQASTGWTRTDWSQYYDDLGVSYRRMDHWFNAFDVVRRRPDGGLIYDFGSLDAALRDSLGGFNFKAYATLDYSPACLTTDFLRNPLPFERGKFRGQLTSAGTLVFWGQAMHGWGSPVDDGMYEVDRKGNILWHADYGTDFFATASNNLIINNANGSIVLDASRKPILKVPTRIIQEVDPKSFLVFDGTHARVIGLDGKTIQEWPGEIHDIILLTKRGLLEATGAEVRLHNGKEITTLVKAEKPFSGVNIAANDAGRILVAYGNYTTKWNYYAIAFDESGKTLWKHDNDFQVDAIRGAAVTSDGLFIVAGVGGEGTIGYDSAGERLWKVDNNGANYMQLHTGPGIETFTLTGYTNTLSEYDVRTGKTVWSYGNVGDESDWITTPPRDLAGWEELAYHTIKHFDKDLDLGWDRWECWNEPGEHGYFWKGTTLDYALTYQATMKGLVRADPAAHLDAYVGDWPNVVRWFAENKVRLDGITFHGYDVNEPNEDISARKAEQAGRFSFLVHDYPGKTPTVGDSEWNLHPGHGEDLSHNYETGYYRAPFQSELLLAKVRNGVTLSSEFSMGSEMTWPSGWVYTSKNEVGGHQPPAGGMNVVFAPAYHAARLWGMLPRQKVALKVNFQRQDSHGTSHLIDGIAAADPQRGDYGVLAWNFSNGSSAAKDESVQIKLHFPTSAGPMQMRHYIIDGEHSTYTAGWDKQYLQATEIVPQAGDGTLTVTLKKDSLHGFFFTAAPLRANAGKPITAAVHQPVHFDGSASTGLPATYRWDFDAADGVDFPEPSNGLPSASHGFGVHPVLARGYAKPGVYKVTLRVSTDQYQKSVATAETSVTVKEESAAPAAPLNLVATSEQADRTAFLQWDVPSLASARTSPVTTSIAAKEAARGRSSRRRLWPTPTTPTRV